MAAIGKPVREIKAEPLVWPLPDKVHIEKDAPIIWTPAPIKEPVKVPTKV
jgi:hypothetical protein